MTSPSVEPLFGAGWLAARWTVENPVLPVGWIGQETDTLKAKVGDGSTAWNALDYFTGAGGVSPSGTSLAWESVTVPTTGADWDTADADGTWTFSAGVIAQTDATTGPKLLLAVADVYAMAWAVEFDGRVDAASVNPPYFAFSAGAHAVGDAFDGSMTGAGIDNDLNLGSPGHMSMSPLSIGHGDGLAINVDVGEWHTYKTVFDGVTQVGYFDGVFTTLVANPSDFAVPSGRSAFMLGVSDGAVSFRNLKAWRIPLPTLPA